MSRDSTTTKKQGNHRKRQSHPHPTRIAFHGGADEFLHAGEVDDPSIALRPALNAREVTGFVEFLVNLYPRHPQACPEAVKEWCR